MTISVTQLNNYIHGILDIDGVLNNVSVCGEISNLKKSRDGWYFALKDEVAAINCFCYDSTAIPEQGSVVVAEGRINYFVKSGTISFFVKKLASTKNTGESFLKFVELKERLKKEGLFDESRKKVVPHSCKTIGVVTSETGAVIHDITNVVLRRQPFSDIILFPVKVQGVGADEEITRGIEYFNDSNVDVVIVGRGGGSNEDLSCFNSEIVVRAVANCKKPVVSAVGHGVDYTLCDFAADKRAVTPTEAGEFVTIDVETIKHKISADLLQIESAIVNRLQRQIDKAQSNLNKIGAEVYLAFEQAKSHVTNSVAMCERVVTTNVTALNVRIESDIMRLSSLNPANVLKRGYAYISNDNGVVKSVSDLSTGSQITLTLSDGQVNAEILEKVLK